MRHRPALGLAVLLLAGPALAQAPLAPTNLTVTQQPDRTWRVCFSGATGADTYHLGGGYTPELQFPGPATGTVCRVVPAWKAPCGQETFAVQSLKTVGGTVWGGATPGMPVLHNPLLADPTVPLPVCDPGNAVPTSTPYEAFVPTGVTLVDATASGDRTPTAKLSATCPTSVPAGNTFERYDVYQSVLNDDGTTATKTTALNACPSNTSLSGDWGQRVTVTVALVASQGTGKNKTYVRSVCSLPATLTFGGTTLPAPALSVPTAPTSGTITVSGSVATTSSVAVLLFAGAPYKLTAPTQTISTLTPSGASQTFTTTLTLTQPATQVWAVTRSGSGNSAKYSAPSQIHLVKRYATPPAAPTLSLPSSQIGGYLVLAGTAAPGATVEITPVGPTGTALPAITTVACDTGAFTGALLLAGLPKGTYTFTARTTDTGSTATSSASVVVNQLSPPPTLTVTQGNGPIYTTSGTITLSGSVSPGSEGPRFTVTGTLGSQVLTKTPGSTGLWNLPAFTLAQGTNTITVTAVHGPTGEAAPPVTVTVVLDTTAPTATAPIATPIPAVTNQATWSLAETVSGFQGLAENAKVQITLNTGTPVLVPVTGAGTWATTITLAEGPNTLTTRVQDAAGNLGPASQRQATLNTKGIRLLFQNLGTVGYGEAWPGSLDERMGQWIKLHGRTGDDANLASLAGTHVDIYLDEPGTPASTTPPSCGTDNLTCLAQRKTTPDLSLDVTTDTQEVTLPPLVRGQHTIRFVVRDSFGKTTERASVVIVGPSHFFVSGVTSRVFEVPKPTFAVPGVVTTQVPKIAGRTASAVTPIDCADKGAPYRPAVSFWDPGAKGGAAWVPLPVKTFTNAGGTFEIVPDAGKLPRTGIPLTKNTAGQDVIRLRLTPGTSTITYMGRVYRYDETGRTICGASNWSDLLLQKSAYGYLGDGDELVDFDLPYRAPVASDNPAPQIDVAAVPPVITDDEAPVTTKVSFRVTDLGGDLGYQSVTIAPQGCSGPACTVTATLAADQKLTSAAPGGYFTATVTLVVGQNPFTVTARDDAGHVTTATLTVTRALSAVVAKITSPTTNGKTFMFKNPQVVTFDAVQSVNRTGQPLRYQWGWPATVDGVVTSWTVGSTASAYSEYLTTAPYPFNQRRVVVSSLAIPAPEAWRPDPCAGITGGQCSTALVYYQRTCSSGQGTGLSPSVTSLTPGATVGMNLTVNLAGTAGNDTSTSYVYRWDLVNTATGQRIALPQAAGTSGEAWANGNRMLSLLLGSLPGVVPGTYELTFSAGIDAFGDGCAQNTGKVTIPITVVAKQYATSGVAPGVFVAGTSSVTLYGSGFDTAAMVRVRGPVYALGNTTTTLCGGSGQPACPTQLVSPLATTDGFTLTFNFPAGLGTGFYQVEAIDQSAGVVSTYRWVEVQPAAVTNPAKAPTFTSVASPIFSGQTISGQLLYSRDTTGQFSDVDYYYFYATAGSRLSVGLTRTDTVQPWEHPDALDPELYVADPDGFFTESLTSLDIKPFDDLNASLQSRLLPKTGVYILQAASTKGVGGYQLTFFVQPAPPSAQDQVVAITNNFRTVPINLPGLKPGAVAFDRLGRPLSGAATEYYVDGQAGETGVVTFPGGATILTSTRGFTQVNATLTAKGPITFGVRLQDPTLRVSPTSPAPWPDELAVTREEVDEGRLFTGWAGATIASFDLHSGQMRLAVGPRGEMRSRPVEAESASFVVGPGGERISMSPRRAGSTPAPRASSPGLTGEAARALLTSTGFCTFSSAKFRALGVNGPVAQGPFTLALRDTTAKIGQTGPANELVGTNGIYGHRIKQTLGLNLEVKDAAQATVTHPVLVRMMLEGTKKGTLQLVSNDGENAQCDGMSFVWHDVDGNGNSIPNDQVNYTLGRGASFVGVIPDPQNAGKTLPVWATAEGLNIKLGTMDAADGSVTTQLDKTYAAKPQPGRPTAFLWNPTGPQPTNELSYLSKYGYTNTGIIQEEIALYYLVDGEGNRTFGFTQARATKPPDPAFLEARFQAQTLLNAYDLMLWWTGPFPNGTYLVPLEVDIPTDPFDPNWGPAATLRQTLVGRFSSTASFYTIHNYTGRTLTDPAYEPEDRDIVKNADGTVQDVTYVSPETAKFSNGEYVRTPFVLYQGTDFKMPVQSLENDPANPNPRIVQDGQDRFNFWLENEHGEVATDAVFEIERCPRYDHSLASVWSTTPVKLVACTDQKLVQRDSSGKILNEPAGTHGYFGLILKKSPKAPGRYYWRVQPATGNQRPYTVNGLAQHDAYLANYAVTVTGGQLLDATFKPADPVVARSLTQGYVRVIDPTEKANQISVAFKAYTEKGVEFQSEVAVPLTRAGVSKTFLGPVQLLPDGVAAPTGATSGGPLRYIVNGVGRYALFAGTKQLVAGTSVAPYKFQIDWVDKSGAPFAEQYTEIEPPSEDPGNPRTMYAEKTYFTVSVRNPYKNNVLVASVNSCGYLQERASEAFRPPTVFSGPKDVGMGPTGPVDDYNASRGGDVLYSPDLLTGEGKPGMLFNVKDGLGVGRDQQAALFLRSVARRRQNQQGAAVAAFSTRILVGEQCKTAGPLYIDPSDEVTLEQWVDQVDYFPVSAGERRHGSLAARNRIDWIEKQALDLFKQPAASGDETLAFRAPDAVYTDATKAHATGGDYTYPLSAPLPDDAFLIHIIPTDVGLRWGIRGEVLPGAPILTEPQPYLEAGMSQRIDPEDRKRFENVLSHEARHALQNRVTNEGYAAELLEETSSDGQPAPDGLAPVPQWDGTTLSEADTIADRRNRRVEPDGNADFDLDPTRADTLGTLNTTLSLPRAIRERDAMRRQRHTTTLTSLVGTLMVFPSKTLPKNNDGDQNPVLVGLLSDSSGGTSANLWGTLVKADIRDGGCYFMPQGTWALLSARQTVVQARVFTPNRETTCRIALTLIKPADKSGVDSEIAAGEITINVTNN